MQIFTLPEVELKSLGSKNKLTPKKKKTLGPTEDRLNFMTCF